MSDISRKLSNYFVNVPIYVIMYSALINFDVCSILMLEMFFFYEELICICFTPNLIQTLLSNILTNISELLDNLSV